MKKKGNRAIPDFSHKRPNAIAAPDQKQQVPSRTVAATHAPIVKPHSTSSKSGRRGQ
jgi:hypothetical protein